MAGAILSTEQDSLVLFTSIKFYQAPPFYGAAMLPSSIAIKVSAVSPLKDMLVGPMGLRSCLTDEGKNVKERRKEQRRPSFALGGWTSCSQALRARIIFESLVTGMNQDSFCESSFYSYT